MSKPSTYHQFAQTDVDNAGGRFARQTPTASGVPQQPETSWCSQGQAVPDEPPLGYSVDALEPVGTSKEIHNSIAERKHELNEETKED